jgi:hypothetical protein
MADGDARLQVVLDAKIDTLIDKLAQTERRLGQFGQTASATANKVRADLDRMSGGRVADQLKAIELANQLAVAQAAGNTKEAFALQQQIAMQRQINDLKRIGLSETEAQAIAEKQLLAVTAARAASVKGEGLGAALGAIGGAGKTAALEEGAAQIGVLGAGLEAIGPAGIAAAVGLGAFFAAFEETHKLAEWSEKLEQASKRLSLSTTTIQEFDHVFVGLGVDVDKGRDALGAMETTISQISSGVARAQTMKIFTQSLNITPEQLRNAGSFKDQLELVLGALEKLNAEQRLGVMAKLKFDPEVTNSLIEGKDRIADLTAEAHKYGLVVDADVIRKSADAAAKMRTASDVIDKNLKVAFAGLIDPIVKATTALAQFVSLLNRVPTTRMEAILKYGSAYAAGGVIGLYQSMKADEKRPGVIGQAFADQGDTDFFGPKPAQLVEPKTPKPKKPKAGPRDDTDERIKAATDALETAMKAAAEATAGLSTDIAARRDALVKAIDAELTKQNADLDAQEQAVAKDKGITEATKKILDDKLELARQADAAAADAKREKANRDAANALDEQALALKERVNSDYDQAAKIEEGLGQTTAQRYATERKILAADQEIARERLAQENEKALQGLTPGTEAYARAQGDASQRSKSQADLQQAQRDQLAYQQRNPLQQFVDENEQAAKDIATVWQTEAVKGINDFNQGLADAIVNGKSLGDVMHSMLKKLESDLIEMALRAAETKILEQLFGISGFGGGPGASTGGTVIPGMAGGGISPGGYTVVGEGGPEIVKLPSGAQVIPNHDLVNPMRGMSGPSAMSRVAQSSIYVTNDLRGAVTDQALDAKIARANQQTAAAVYQSVKKAMPGWQVDYQYQRA